MWCSLRLLGEDLERVKHLRKQRDACDRLSFLNNYLRQESINNCIDVEQHGPVVKWYNATFALWRRESDSPQVHRVERGF